MRIILSILLCFAYLFGFSQVKNKQMETSASPTMFLMTKNDATLGNVRQFVTASEAADTLNANFSFNNIYNIDGTLTGTRSLSLAGYDLTFLQSGIGDVVFYGNNAVWTNYTNSHQAKIGAYNSGTFVGSESASPFEFRIGNTAQAIIESDGDAYYYNDLGVGISPAYALDVVGEFRLNNATEGIDRVLRSDANGLASWVDLGTLGGGTDDQTLSLVTNTLSIEDGNSVSLTPYLDNTDNQTLSFASPNLSISGGNSVDISAIDTDTQLSQEQVEDYVGGMVTGNTETGITVTYQDIDGTLDFVASDVSASNEYNTNVALVGNDLQVTDGGGTLSTSLAVYLDNTDSQGFDVSQLVGTDLQLSLDNDGEATKIIDLSSLDDSGTDDQTLQEVLTSGNDAGGLDAINFAEVEADEFIGDLRGAVLFKAQAGENLLKGEVVYVSGISGNTTIVSKADADDAAKMPAFGVVAVAANSGNPVDIYTFGTLSNLNTLAFSLGDILYVSTTAGQLTATPPTGESALIQNIAKVTRVDNSAGSIKISGAGRTNATPNLNTGRLFVGNASNQAVADGTMYVDIANSRVGIGTSSPSGILEISSTGTGDESILRISNGAGGNERFHIGYRNAVPDDNVLYGQILLNSQGDLSIASRTNNPSSIIFYTNEGTAASERMRIDDYGKVGIGTNLPGTKLEIESTGGDHLRLRYNTGGNYYWDIARESNGRLSFTDGTYGEAVSILSTGEVGIGTSNPLAKLDVVGTSEFSDDMNVDSNTFFVDASTNRVGIGTNLPSETLTIYASNGGFLLYDSNNNGSAPYMEVIGRRLAGNNTTQAFGGGLALSRITGSQLTTGINLGSIYFGGNHTDGTEGNLLYTSSISAESDGSFTNSTTMPTRLVFRTGSTGRALGTPNVDYGIDRMVIDSDGDVGIGLTNPSQKLQVAGNIYTADNGSTNTIRAYSSAGDFSELDGTGIRTSRSTAYIRPQGDGTENIGIGQTGFQYNAILNHYSNRTDFSLNSNIVMRVTDYLGIYDSSQNLDIKLNPNGDSYINGSGNVGIGTSSPSARLSVKGSSAAADIPVYLIAGDHSNSYAGILFRDTANSTSWGGILARKSPNYGNLKQGGLAVNSYGNDLTLTAYNGHDISIWTNTGGSSLNSVQRVTVQNSGNVGIGTSNPSEKLQVEGNILIEENAKYVRVKEQGVNNYASLYKDKLVISNEFGGAYTFQDGGITSVGTAGGFSFRQTLGVTDDYYNFDDGFTYSDNYNNNRYAKFQSDSIDVATTNNSYKLTFTKYPLSSPINQGSWEFHVDGSFTINANDPSNKYTLPANDGTNGQVLTTDGAGNVTFQTIGGSTDGNGIFDGTNDGSTVPTAFDVGITDDLNFASGLLLLDNVVQRRVVVNDNQNLDVDFIIKTGAFSDAFFLNGNNGQITLGRYGTGAVTGTETYILGVETDGRIVEVGLSDLDQTLAEVLTLSNDASLLSIDNLSNLTLANNIIHDEDTDTKISFGGGENNIDFTAGGVLGLRFETGLSSFNIGGANHDFRIDGQTADNILRVNASADNIGFNGINATSEFFYVNGTSRFVDDMGIGGAPSARLDVIGTTELNGTVSVQDDIIHIGDTGTKIGFTPSVIDLNAASVNGIKVQSTEVAINNGGANLDFRVQSQTNANLLLADASANSVAVLGDFSVDTDVFTVDETTDNISMVSPSVTVGDNSQIELVSSVGTNSIEFNGGSVRISNGTTDILNIQSDEDVTWSARALARIHDQTSHTITTATEITGYDVGAGVGIEIGDITVNEGNGTITVTNAGYYQVSFSADFVGDTSADGGLIELRESDVAFAQWETEEAYHVGALRGSHSVSFPIFLNAGDVLSLWAVPDTGDTFDIQYISFSVERLIGY